MKRNLILAFAAFLPIVIASNCGRLPDDSPSPAHLWKPKEGTSYVGEFPQEIIWLKDGAEMVLVPAGEFLYGEHKETRSLPSFCIDKYPVTNERYRRFVKATGHPPPYTDAETTRPFNWKGDNYPKGKARYPVVLVDWHDAAAFCKWAGKTLPTDEQWEKAARGTDGRAYPWGEEFDEKKCNCWLTGIETITPVDRFPNGASPYGCFDMAGNVWQWTSTRKNGRCMARGGSYLTGDVYVRCYTTTDSQPWADPNWKKINGGLRSCYVLPPE